MESMSNTPLIIAHRGASAYAPENTLSAFLLAVNQGCHGIELDVHLTKDRQLVVIHNEEISKTTNGKGYIKNMTVHELKQLDAGSWFHPNFKGERIPLLEEVMDVIPSNIIVNIEIKNIPSFYEGIEHVLVQLIRYKNLYNRVIVSSFDHQCLLKVYELDPKIKLGLLYEENLYSHAGYANQIGIPIYSLHPKYVCIKEKDVQLAIKNGYHVFPWTVNNKNRMRTLIKYGVTGIMTDDPIKLKKAMSL